MKGFKIRRTFKNNSIKADKCQLAIFFYLRYVSQHDSVAGVNHTCAVVISNMSIVAVLMDQLLRFVLCKHYSMIDTFAKYEVCFVNRLEQKVTTQQKFIGNGGGSMRKWYWKDKLMYLSPDKYISFIPLDVGWLFEATLTVTHCNSQAFTITEQTVPKFSLYCHCKARLIQICKVEKQLDLYMKTGWMLVTINFSK